MKGFLFYDKVSNLVNKLNTNLDTIKPIELNNNFCKKYFIFNCFTFNSVRNFSFVCLIYLK